MKVYSRSVSWIPLSHCKLTCILNKRELRLSELLHSRFHAGSLEQMSSLPLTSVVLVLSCQCPGKQAQLCEVNIHILVLLPQAAHGILQQPQEGHRYLQGVGIGKAFQKHTLVTQGILTRIDQWDL